MWILEQPLAILFVGVVVVAILGGGLVQTGRASLLYAMIGAIVLTAALLILERVVVTEVEEVEGTLHQIAANLERNDANAVLEYISSNAESLKDEARRNMGLVVISDVKIKQNLKIEVVSNRDPPVAEARFNAVIRARDRAGQIGERLYPRYFVVNFRRENGLWRVRDYEMMDARKGM